MLETIKALYRSHSIAPGRSTAYRLNDKREDGGEGDSFYVELTRDQVHPFLPFLWATSIEASITQYQKFDSDIKERSMKTGVVIYSILGLLPFARRYSYESFRDFDGRRGDARRLDVATLNRALANTTRRSGAVTNY